MLTLIDLPTISTILCKKSSLIDENRTFVPNNSIETINCTLNGSNSLSMVDRCFLNCHLFPE